METPVITELQQYIWTILGIATVLTIQWLMKKLFSNLDKNKQIALNVAEEDRSRIESKIDQSTLTQHAMVYALCNMNTSEDLKLFSKEFKRSFISAKDTLKNNPELVEIN